MAASTKKSGGATIRDIARHAGVSIGTVSRVLNGVPNIEPEIYRRTVRAIKACNYRPRTTDGATGPGFGAAPQHNTARMRQARTRNIGVLCYDLSQKWRQSKIYLDYITGVEAQCASMGYHPVFEFMSSQQQLVPPRCITEGKVDGLLIKANSIEPILIEKLQAIRPVVLLDSYFPSLPFDQVAVNDHGAGVAVVEYLLSLGHRRIAFVNVQPTHRRFLARGRGYQDAMQLRGLHDPSLLIERDLFGAAFDAVNDPMPSVEPVVQMLVDLRPLPTAVVFSNDWAAHSSYACFAQHGISVGRDISVMGFDNTVPLCDVLSPPLASYALPFKTAAELATRKLLGRIENPRLDDAVPQAQLILGHVVPRSSVQPVVSRDGAAAAGTVSTQT
jgi:LacI family transcriptional regulator